MSAFNVSDEHIRYLVCAYHRYSRTWHDIEDLRGYAVMLRNANTQSTSYLYGDRHPDMRGEMVTDFPLTMWEMDSVRVEPVQVLKACACYEYQACEPPGWEASPAHEWLERLTHITEQQLPGWDDAEWEITDARPAAPTEPGPVGR